MRVRSNLWLAGLCQEKADAAAEVASGDGVSNLVERPGLW